MYQQDALTQYKDTDFKVGEPQVQTVSAAPNLFVFASSGRKHEDTGPVYILFDRSLKGNWRYRSNLEWGLCWRVGE
jgi:hypothetical protein